MLSNVPVRHSPLKLARVISDISKKNRSTRILGHGIKIEV